MKTKINFKLILTGLILFIFIADLQAQFNFQDVTNQSVLSYGASSTWDDGAVWFPAVIKDGDTLRMWYTGLDDLVWAYTDWKIGYAWSLDGIEWYKFAENPVLSTDMVWEGNTMKLGAVIKDGNTYKIWYQAIEVGYAESLDGINWTKNPEPVLYPGPSGDWDDDFICPWTVIKQDNEYKMFYYAGRPGLPQLESLPQIGLATSPDGISWSKYDNPATSEAPYKYSDPVYKLGETGTWDSHRVIDPMVLKKDTGYEMLYAGYFYPNSVDQKQQIGYATSDDGIVWVRHPNNPIITEPREWGYGIYGGSVLKYNENYHLWYACFHTPPYEARPQIGYAISDALGIDDYQQILHFQTYHNWPNPFTSSTTIEYELKQPEKVSLSIYNHLGQLVYQTQELQPQGKQQLIWNAERFPDGIYYYRLQVGEQTANGKMVKVR